MGSPLVPIIADLIMNKLLDTTLPHLTFTPSLTIKYVDDLLFAPETELENFLKLLNSFHERIQFTYEKQEQNQLNYLDMTIHIDGDMMMSTSWYSKPTSKYRLLNFNSSHSYTQKMNIVYSTIRRTLLLSSQKFWTENIKRIYAGLTKNNYPTHLIETNLNKFISSTQPITPTTTLPTNDLPNTNNNQSTQLKFTSITFIDELSTHISLLFREFIPPEQLKITYRTENNNKSKFFTKTKDKTEKGKTCNAVYKINCKECNCCYVGETSQYITKRMYQHSVDMRKHLNPPVQPKPTTPNPNRLLPYPIPIITTPTPNNSPTPTHTSPHPTNTSPILTTPNTTPNIIPKDYTTALAYHSRDFKHEFDLNDFKILCIENNHNKRLTKEALFILANNNAINKKADTQGVSKIYIDLI